MQRTDHPEPRIRGALGSAGNLVSNWTGSAGLQYNGLNSHSGQQNALLNGYYGFPTVDTIAQTVNVPKGCKAVLSYYLAIRGFEPSHKRALDFFTVTANGKQFRRSPT